jgi:DnaK suppressor protein
MDEKRARALLEAERAEVRGLLGITEEEVQESIEAETEQGGVDVGDLARPLEDEADEAAIQENLEERLDRIERALRRLDEGSYGRSVLSGKPIPDERLEADPAAELTIEEARAQSRA